MNGIISKELFSEVLEINCERVYNGTWTDYPKTNKTSTDIKFKYVCHETLEYINIYELAHKCKEWARNKGYILFSSVTKSLKGICLIKTPNGTPYPYRATTEPEAVFKATQYIYDNLSNL